MKIRCISCGRDRKGNELFCECGSPFEIIPDFKYYDDINRNFPYIKRFISLGEVETPVIKRHNFSMKLDYFSPTFSYKDRGSRTLISYVNDLKINEINEDSSGNAGASIAGYGAAAGIKVKIFVPENASAAKLRQIMSYGAQVIKIKGSRDDVQRAAQESGGFYASHILRPEFRDGIRTLAYEIFNQGMPDHIYVPVSAGTLLLGLYSGLKHLYESSEIKTMPKIIGVQPENISPVCSRLNNIKYDPDNNLTSIADALVSKRPVLIERMLEALYKCISVSEEEIKIARDELAASGIYVEYSSATVYAAYKKVRLDNSMLILTGNGLKNQ
ncbi:pyridoxal-phosphate dependent enzyme [Picrophilus oshimae]|uniref:Threonine synthase n=1 Tax=Picrophilus torridus (strain ATCC 700027 / DSM 9790 / JCM 10055 / NBRC 100828 / KAW 2/3) TaxID=1122961 RepID=Q6L1Z9_PICTO|nr:pyridoxal-phosphate dependent enzyme [Picrophilus oshimae]AAT43003.1 threonine synthase [Picrophilus oshimae DSM 9789]